ncbi:hypothetical protein [Lacrimispora sp. 38-1]|uniref:hypothetical protein n=1 Tax=Lacrimispora sp. 38-1 TaxID=3125778 RepID=UPI003CECA78F
MNQETIKVGEVTYNIANGSCSLNDLSGQTAKVAIIIGSNKIEDIHKNLSQNSIIVKYSADGVEEWRQGNLVYTGLPIFNPSFPVRIEQVQETDEEGKPKYINKEIMDAVIIVEYRTPNIQDKVKEQEQQINDLNAQVAYLRMMSTPKEV